MGVEKGFWNKLSVPTVGMAPMDGVTDAACRWIAKRHGQADVVYTEFVSAEGLWRINKRQEFDHKIWKELRFSKEESPVVVQLFGSDPKSFYDATMIVGKMGFDGIDINMGCPSPGLEKSGGGAGLIRVPECAGNVVAEVRRAVGDLGLNLPVSVKTRIGSSVPEPDWWDFLASLELPVVAMHGRTFKQLYSGEADWEVLSEAARVIRKSGALFLANGDVKGVKIDGREWKAKLNSGKEVSGEPFDGVLVGRNVVGNPWVLRKDGLVPNLKQRLEVAVEQARAYEKLFPGDKFFPVRKHLAGFVSGVENAGELRRKLVMTNSADEVEKVVKELNIL